MTEEEQMEKSVSFNPLMLNVPKWSDTHLAANMCLTILGHYLIKGLLTLDITLSNTAVSTTVLFDCDTCIDRKKHFF